MWLVVETGNEELSQAKRWARRVGNSRSWESCDPIHMRNYVHQCLEGMLCPLVCVCERVRVHECTRSSYTLLLCHTQYLGFTLCRDISSIIHEPPCLRLSEIMPSSCVLGLPWSVKDVVSVTCLDKTWYMISASDI